MRARFWPSSLLIEVQGEACTLDASAFAPGRWVAVEHRALFHEAVHYWQQISQSFLVGLAAENWERLLVYEQRGEVTRPGPVSAEFNRVNSTLEASAKDLHECLARFWDVIAVGPRRVVEMEWETRRAEALPDVVKLYRMNRAGTTDDADTWGEEDFNFAMIMVAGDYAAPYTALGHTGLQGAIFAFPWLAHSALQTDNPAEAFVCFLDTVGDRLTGRIRQLLKDPSVPASARFLHTLTETGFAAAAWCRTAAQECGHEIRSVYRTYRGSSLTTHPVYRWAFEGPLMRAAKALRDTQVVARLAARMPERAASQDALTAAALQFLYEMLATPGLVEGRTLLLLGGLAPPCVRFSDGAVISLTQLYRQYANAQESTLRQDDAVWALTTPVREHATSLELEEQYASERALTTQSRWEAFLTAQRASAT